MALNSRAKGQRAERQAIGLLQPIVDKVYTELGLPVPSLERNLMQSMKGGYDIIGVDWMALEIKHHETLHLDAWWEQTVRQAGNDKTPVLMYKKNRTSWSVILRVFVQSEQNKVRCPGIISIESFLVWFELQLKQKATK